MQFQQQISSIVSLLMVLGNADNIVFSTLVTDAFIVAAHRLDLVGISGTLLHATLASRTFTISRYVVKKAILETFKNQDLETSVNCSIP